jgi:hypothetical protein
VAFKLGSPLRVIKDPVALRFSVSGNLTSQIPALRRTLAQAKSYSEAWTQFDTKQAEYEKQMKEYEAAKAKYDATQKEATQKEAAQKEAQQKEPAKEGETKKDDSKPAAPAQGASESKSSSSGQTESKSSSDKPAESKDAAKTSESKPPTMPTAPTKPQAIPAMEPFRELFAGRIPAMVEVRKANAITEAVKLFRDEFQLKTILLNADDVARKPELLSGKQVAVVAGTPFVQTIDQQRVNFPQVLANNQIPFGFQSQATTGVQMLPLAVQYLVSQGLSGDAALAGLTASPARFLAIDKSVGTLEIGKDADLVVLSGPPFEPSSQVLAVMIDGKWVYEREENR